MKDRNLLLRLEAQEGGPGAAALTIGISGQSWSNWKNKALPSYGRLLVHVALNRTGRRLIQDALERKEP